MRSATGQTQPAQTASPRRASRDVVLDVRDVVKRFGETLALQNVSMQVRRGEVHALLGHNGSGKSTTVKIISGVVAPDAGTVAIYGAGGKPAQIGVVHQDLGLCYDATVLENCCMAGYQSTRFGHIDWDAERRQVAPILDSLAADFSCDETVRHLSPANQTIVAIARALKRAGPAGALDLLILDEATARLRGRDADKVLATASLVAGQGGGVLIVTHHMAEVLRAANRATVLMNGRVAGAVDVAHTTEEELLTMASGRQVAARSRKGARGVATPDVVTPSEASPGKASLQVHAEVALSVSRLRGQRIMSDTPLIIHTGEIVGLTGAPGAGFEEVPYLIAGVTRGGSAQVAVFGKPMHGRGVRAGRRQSLGLVPAERLTQGLLLQADVRENLSPIVRRQHTWANLLSRRREVSWAHHVCGAFQIGAAQPASPVSTLSGGNQQKVLLARVLEDKPKVLLLHEPTEGVDEMTRRSLVDLIQKVAAEGTAVLYVSSDIGEVAECSDRVLVVRDGAIAAELPGGSDMADTIYAACYLTGESEACPCH